MFDVVLGGETSASILVQFDLTEKWRRSGQFCESRIRVKVRVRV